MADHTKIEWADATVNAVNGCSVVSPGCSNCYAMRLAGTRMKNHPTRAGLTNNSKAGPVWNGEVRLHEPALLQPLRWRRPRKIFWNAHGDLFHPSVPDEWIDRVFAVCGLSPQHTHMILTKRSERMRQYLNDKVTPHRIDLIQVDLYHDHKMIRRDVFGDEGKKLASSVWPLPNVWLGVSVEDQARADERIPDLLATPATKRFISAEPLLGPVDLTHICLLPKLPGSIRGGIHLNSLAGKYFESGQPYINWDTDTPYPDNPEPLSIDWVIVGGESGPNARPMYPDWARGLRDECAEFGVPFMFKQWGEWAPICEMPEEMIDGVYHPAPDRHPDAPRRCKVNQCVLHGNGQRFDGRAMFERPAFEQGSGAMTMFAIGKARAGRLLDGVEHNGVPA